jgi:hypothetical protein
VMEVGSLAGTDLDVWIFPEGYPNTLYFHDMHNKFGIEFNSLRNQCRQQQGVHCGYIGPKSCEGRST